MALNAQPESSQGIMAAIRGALGLFSDTNKAQGSTDAEQFVPTEEYKSNLSDLKIIELVSLWKRTYAVYYEPISKTQEAAFNYWIGKQKLDENAELTKEAPNLIDNLIFEAVETFLPIATRANPDPLASADPSEDGQRFAKAIKEALVHEADTQKLRRKLARLVRHWIIYRLGVVKVVWDVHTKSIKTEIINPRRIVFDKDGYIDEGGHFIGEYLGEKRRNSADLLVEMFPHKKSFITKKVNGKMGTKLEWFEWWYKGDEVFYTLDEIVLGKFKNPNWNYDGTTKEKDPLTDEYVDVDVQGINHLKKRESPYVFLSIFSTGLHPHDDTSLILQNIPIQDMINRRWRQIDKNVEGMNNGMIVSGKSFTEEQASQAAAALRRGQVIRVPDGNVEGAAKRFPPEPLPNDVFNTLNDGRSELRNIFGTSGSTPQGVSEEKSVRGKIMVNQQDSSRIGGGITEQIEQVADTIYNWWVQFMFVYYDDEHFITTAGATGGAELIILKKSNFPILKTLTITVKEGSLIPKDPLTQRNEAIDLWSANAIDPLTFFKKLDYPDPVQATQQLILWQMLQQGRILPQQYLPSFEIPQTGQLPQEQAGTGGPAVNPLGPAEQQPTPQLQTQGAVEQQSAQLLGAVPIPK